MKAPTKEQALKSTWLFSECSAKELRSIAGIADEVTVPEGKVLVEQGAIGREFYLITSGSASVKRNGRQVATLKKGQHFGELALLDRRPRNATVISATEMTVMVLGQREFNGLIETVPSLARKLLAAMAGRVRDQDRKAVQ
jgi:cAMP-dependent protein kinase regulator